VIAAAGPLVIFGVFLHSQNSLLNGLGATSAFMIHQGFSQEFETEADDAGWGYLVSAGIDPRGMIEAFDKLRVHEELELKESVVLPEAFQSHPAIGKRIGRLKARWASLPRTVVFAPLTNSIPQIPLQDVNERELRRLRR
jgi:predicted Zn-dependent protease